MGASPGRGWPDLTTRQILGQIAAARKGAAESATPLPEPARTAALEALAGAGPIEFFVLDTERFWVHDAPEAVRRLRALIEPRSR